MEKFYLLIYFVIFLFYSSLSAQEGFGGNKLGNERNPKVEETVIKSNNFWGIDFHLFGTSLHYARSIAVNFFLGGELGLLPDKLDWVLLAGKHFTEENTIWSNDRSEEKLNQFGQIFFIHLFGRWKSECKWFEFDVGLRRARYIYSVPHEDRIDSSVFNGGYIKPSIGYKKFKIGTRLDFGDMSLDYGDVNEFVIMFTPYVRINFR
jgi:hypothetical protein